MPKLSDLTFISLDTETTHLKAAEGRIVEIAAVRFTAKGEVLGQFQSLVRQEQEIPAEVQAVHGITTAMTAGAPDIMAAMRMFYWFLNQRGAVWFDVEHTVLLAHNASFDVGFINAETLRLGYASPQLEVFDTVIMARAMWPKLANHRLATLAEEFGLTAQDHRALGDCHLVRQVFARILLDADLERDASEPMRAIPGAYGKGYYGSASPVSFEAHARQNGHYGLKQ